MTQHILNTRIKLKKDSHDSFQRENPVLLDGELIIVDDGTPGIKVKFGDGVSTYSQLPFFGTIYSEKPEYSYREIAGLSDILNELQGRISMIPIIPSGMISIWSGSVDNIPDGWTLCNGSNGTPDLSDKFVIGAGRSYDVGVTGGEESHTLTASEIAPHTHSLAPGVLISSEYTSGFTVGQATNKEYTRIGSITTTASSGDGQAHNNMPPYYSLCYIMKL